MLEAQDRIDNIINGEEQGHYYLLIGEKVITSAWMEPVMPDAEFFKREPEKHQCYLRKYMISYLIL